MLSKSFFQETMTRFSAEFLHNNSFGEWTLDLLYTNLKHLEPDQLLRSLSEFLITRPTNLLPTPEPIIKKAYSMFPNVKTNADMEKSKEERIRESQAPDIKCDCCFEKGVIIATERRQLNNHSFKTKYDKEFKCFCPNSVKADVSLPSWSRTALKDYEPEYERLSKGIVAKTLNDLIPGVSRKEGEAFKGRKTLTTEIYQQLGNLKSQNS